MSKENKTCKLCYYFVEIGVSPGYEEEVCVDGSCYRFPPTGPADEGEAVNTHPIVLSDNWCGEWHPKEVFNKT